MNRRRTSSQGCLYFGVFFFQFLDINVFKFFKTVQKDIVKFKLHFKFYYG